MWVEGTVDPPDLGFSKNDGWTTQFPLVNQLTIIFTVYNYIYNYLHGHYWWYTPFSDKPIWGIGGDMDKT